MAEPSERMKKLQAMLEKQPSDPFLLYGLAIEHRKTGDAAGAIHLFDQVLRIDPAYCYAYHQKGLAYESVGDMEAARQSYRDGVAAAQRSGDAHAQGEIAAALEAIE